MNKKVLVISSSPRKGGNSDLLCDQFVLGAQKSGNVAEKIFLKEKKLNYCFACGSCYEDGKSCPQKDDMAEILQKMIDADVICMATPVYFYTMCGQMKTLIDRTVARHTEISNKDFYFIATAADANAGALKRTIEEFRGFTSCLENPTEKGVVYGVGAWKIGDIKSSATMYQAYEMGNKIN